MSGPTISCEWCNGTGTVVSYGPFAGGDPRRFTPDAEDCTPKEIARHAEAVAAAERGEDASRAPGCATMGDGSVHAGGGFGIGTNVWGCDCDAGQVRP